MAQQSRSNADSDADDPRQAGANDTPSLTPALSIIVPTRNEAGNIEELLTRIERTVNGVTAEVIFVDDSTDDTPSVISRMAQQCRVPVSMIHHPPERRGDGLGGAVTEGFRAARGEFVCVMDADLQHPPEVLSDLLQSARRTQSDVVIASRYVGAASHDGLGRVRSAVSRATTLAARIAFPRRLWRVHDPLSGYFLVRRELIDPSRLKPRGFKILLEILARFPHLSVSEIPFRFDERKSGDSKASLREGLRYLRHLTTLRFGDVYQRPLRFALVGVSGIGVNQLLLAAFTDLGGIHYLLSAVLATQGSTLWNFGLTETWVFRDRPGRHTLLQRMAQFFAMNNALLLLRGPFLVAPTSGLGIHYLVSNLITLVTLTVIRFLVADGWIWSRQAATTVHPSYKYDIHGLLRVESDVRLPELEYFLVSELNAPLDVRVRKFGSRRERAAVPQQSSGDLFVFNEFLGLFGFSTCITLGDTIEVEASWLLRKSPHVLYTNVVEPILRWLFVQKGYALVHGACIAAGEQAVLVSAQTDTGKTTTVLRTLTNSPYAFTSDDMTIVAGDGRLFTYPKPLTISRHTLEAVNGAFLTLRQRAMLHIQSRVHSRSGRRAAHALARCRMPVASLNTLVQILIPPPKYRIEQLVPGVGIAREAWLCTLVLIERGSDAEKILGHSESPEILLQNCEDAYGFPPYAELAGFLLQSYGEGLREVERRIIGESLRNCPAVLIHSQNRNWWQRLPSVVETMQVQPAAPTLTEMVPNPSPVWQSSEAS